LKGRIKGFVSGTAVFLTLLCAAGSTPFGKEIYDRVVIEQTMSSIYAGEPCMTRALLTIKASDLLDATATEFNFNAQGLSEGAYARRVCLVQLAISLDGQSPGPIDGVFGPRSHCALDAFKQKHNLKHEDVTDVELQRELAKAFHKGLRDMAR
jgi:peptidoglycan hydrolase-like protein with peptidoglycan-binding domain